MANITPRDRNYQQHVGYQTRRFGFNGSSSPDKTEMGDFHPGENPSTGREQIEQIFDSLFRRKWLIVFSFVVMLGVAALYSYVQKPVYMARSYIMVDLESNQRSGMSAEGQALLDDNSFFSTNNRTLRDELFVLQNSHHLVERVAQRLLEEQFVPRTSNVLPILVTKDGERLEKDQLMSRIPSQVGFDQVRGSSNIVQVIGQSSEPAEAGLLSNFYASEYVELTKEARTARLTRSREFLQEQLARRRSELHQAEAQLEVYLREQEVVGLDQEAGADVVRLAGLEATRDDALLELDIRRSTLATLEQELDQFGEQEVDRIVSNVDQRIDAVQTKIGDLRNSRNRIENRYPNLAARTTDTQDELTRIDAQIEQLELEARRLAEEFVGSEGGVGSEGLSRIRQRMLDERTRIRELETQVGQFANRIASYRSELQSFPKQSIELARLERTRVYAERMVELLSDRLLNIRLAGEAERASGYVHVIRQAGGGRPAGRDTARNLMMGGLLGLLVGIGLAMVSDKMDSRIFKPDQIRSSGYGELGAIPDMQEMLKGVSTGNNGAAQNGQKMFAPGLVAVTSPASAAAEAYRFLRTNIEFGFGSSGSQSLLVTSPNVGEGKSITAGNLAVLLARAGRRTVLIDADLRRPRLHTLFGLDQEPGLVELLLNKDGDIRTEEVGIANLRVLPAGRIHRLIQNGDGEPAEVLGADELLASGRMNHIIQKLRADFDFIIIDSPPALAATDAALMSQWCDGTMLVTRAGSTKERELNYAAEVLTGVGAHIVGILLNGFDSSMAYGYKYRYESYGTYTTG